MLRPPPLVALMLLAPACAPAGGDRAASAITGGVDDAAHPAVVALVDADGKVGCTGVVIAPHAVLTAAHCLGAPGGPLQQRVFAGPVFGAGAELSRVTDAVAHPEYDRSTLAHDLALLTIEKATAAAPLAIDARAPDATWVGQTFQSIGFGKTAAGVPDEGRRRSGTGKVTAVGASDFTAAPSPSQPCTGDSGGPAIFASAGAAQVTGLASHGDVACTDHAVFMRLDVARAAFIDPYLAATAPGTARVGERCLYAEQCVGGSCLQTADEPLRSYCSQPCAGDEQCPAGMSCAPDGCRYPLPSPGAIGSACDRDSACVSETCYVTAGAQGGLCTRRCVSTEADCPADFRCLNATGVTFYCLRAPPGCAIGGRDGAAGVVGLALGLLAITALARARARAGSARWPRRPGGARPRSGGGR
jgi:hypothetical protein